MPTVRIDVDGDVAIERELTGKAARLGGETFTVVRRWGLALRTKVIAHASGRPGPRRRTGDYTRSWSAQTHVQGLSVQSDVGTNAPQGPRLEFGFTDTDALGRHYNQPPFPHARPALAEIVEPFEADMIRVAEL